MWDTLCQRSWSSCGGDSKFAFYPYLAEVDYFLWDQVQVAVVERNVLFSTKEQDVEHVQNLDGERRQRN